MAERARKHAWSNASSFLACVFVPVHGFVHACLLNAQLTSTFRSDRIGRDLRPDKRSYSNNALQRDQEKEAHKVMKILTVVVIVFALLMLPNHIFFLWFDFGNGGK